MTTMVAAVALLSCALGVTVGLATSSPSVELYAPATVQTAAARPLALTPSNSAPRAPVYQTAFNPEEAQYSDEVTEESQYMYNEVPQTNGVNWVAASLFAASAAAAAAFFTMKKQVASGYEAIREDPEAVFTSAGKAFGLAATSAVLAGSANAASLTYAEKYSLSYTEMKGSGLSNTCPVLATSTGSKLDLRAGKYKFDNMCLEPSSFMVRVPSPDKTPTDFQKSKLMTRLTYTLDGIRGDIEVDGSGTWTMKELDGIDYAATTVKLGGGQLVPFLFTVKDFEVKGDGQQFIGQFNVPSYRGSTFLDPKGRGGATGYDYAIALPGGGAGDSEELQGENTKNMAPKIGTVAFKIAKVNAETGEVAGVFESIQPSDDDMGAKTAKDLKISGVWYAQITPA